MLQEALQTIGHRVRPISLTYTSNTGIAFQMGGFHPTAYHDHCGSLKIMQVVVNTMQDREATSFHSLSGMAPQLVFGTPKKASTMSTLKECALLAALLCECTSMHTQTHMHIHIPCSVPTVFHFHIYLALVPMLTFLRRPPICFLQFTLPITRPRPQIVKKTVKHVEPLG